MNISTIWIWTFSNCVIHLFFFLNRLHKDYGANFSSWHIVTWMLRNQIQILVFEWFLPCYSWIHFSSYELAKSTRYNNSRDFPSGAVVKNCLLRQGTRVQARVWEDPTCCGATKPMRHNYWACALEPACHNYWACVPQLLKPACLEPVLHSKRSHCDEKPAHCNRE